ncbi:MAG: hypothetical protein Q6354_08685, partial [Candidatus Brocadiales bacterium]|nr:hypothetical protein [Candidatus Brocadiales bacterium]
MLRHLSRGTEPTAMAAPNGARKPRLSFFTEGDKPPPYEKRFCREGHAIGGFAYLFGEPLWPSAALFVVGTALGILSVATDYLD